MLFGLIGSFLGSIVTIAALVLGLSARRRFKSLKVRMERTEERVDSLDRELRFLKSGLKDTEPGTADIFGTDAERERVRPAVVKAETDPPKAQAAPEATAAPSNASKKGGERQDATSVPAIAARSAGNGTVPPSTPPPSVPQGPASGSFEERLGTLWAVWAGGIALALGGLFLVRYSIEAGLIGPGVRVALGALLAAALIAGGEWMRRNDFVMPVDALPQAHIPSVLTAAGTIVAFGTIYAAHALYGFIGPAMAFVLLGATGIATMLASALHGPALAGLGLAGSFAAPLLVVSTDPNFWPLTLYFGAVSMSAYLLARTRGWLWLALTAVAGGALWGLIMLTSMPPSSMIEPGRLSLSDAAMAHILLQLALALGFLAYEPHLGGRDETAHPDWIALGGIAALALVAAAFLASAPFEYWGWQVMALAAIALLTATGWLTAPAAGALLVAGAIAIVALSAWPGLQLPPDKTLLAPYAAAVLRLPENIATYLTSSALWTLPPAALAAYRIWRGANLPLQTAALYSLAATAPPLLAVILAYLRVTQFDISIPFALGAAALAAAFAAGADRFQKADQAYTVPAYNLASGALAAAAIAGLALALTFCLSRGYLTMALALTALGTAYVSALRDIPLLRHVVTALGVLVALRLVYDPRIMGDGVGTTPVFNWLLAGYGVPAFAFWQSARLLEGKGNDISVRISDSLAIIFAGLLAFFEIRHATNGGDVLRAGSHHVEAGLMTLVAILMSFALARLNFSKSNPVFDTAATVIGAGAIAISAFGLAIGTNPYFSGDTIGGRNIVSSLLVAYLLPGIAALFAARHAKQFRPPWYTTAAGILAVALIFLYVTLETRHVFQGPLISQWLETSEPESWAYSVVWLVLGIAFLAYGLLRGSLEARMASAALIVLAAIKVTVFDLAGIGGIWRALSFISLGAVLIGIGLVYQKLVFAPGRRD